MKLDIESKEALIEIQKEQKAKGNELSIEELADIVESQFTAAKLGFKKGLEIRLPIFGTFIRKHGFEKGEAGRKLKEFKDIFGEEEYARRVLEAKLYNKEQTKKRRREVPKLTFKDVKDTDNITNAPNKYDKLL
jgi:hypothetical protein